MEPSEREKLKQTDQQARKRAGLAERDTSSTLGESVKKFTAKLPPVDPKQQEAKRRERLEREEAHRRWEVGHKLQSLNHRVGKRYADCCLTNFQVYDDKQKPIVDTVTGYADRLVLHEVQGDGIVFFGPPGTGKDHLLVALLKDAIRGGYSVSWVNGLELFGQFRDAMDGHTSEESIIEKYTEPDILGISDPIPPFGSVSDFQAQILFRLIDRRYRKLKPILSTMNAASGKEAEQRIGPAVIDRLRHGSLALHCDWKSYRGMNRDRS